MDFASVLLTTFISTVLMTAFSYVITLIFQINLVEPYWLNRVLFKGKQNFKPVAWILHFITGIGFLYLLLFLLQFLDNNFLIHDYIIGMIEGIIGIAMWQLLFSIKFKPATLKKRWYYFNLLGAHLVFSFTALYIIYGL